MFGLHPVAMTQTLLRFFFFAVSLSLYPSLFAQNFPPTVLAQPPHAEREFRAAWVATVANINWPSKPGLPVDSQQKEALALLDFLKANNFNAVVFQVRPQADALYQSSLEPWSYYLTGQQGKAPEPFYDPLQFWLEAAHDRGLELHVWLNPYRAHHPVGGPVTDSSIVKKKPELVLPLKDTGYWWFDPSLKGTKEHATAVVLDLVKRYDIDGVHFDDYFYPYKEYNKGEDFPDSASYAAYKKSGGTLSRGDWRRDAVNSFISNLYTQIKKEKKWVKFGLSPFGIWRPGYPEGICCFDQYDILYADAKLWLNKGWVDYFSPQLYWSIARMNTSFPLLLGWWRDENTMKRHLWPGINVGDTSAKATLEVTNQIMTDRGLLPQSKGVIHWSIGQVVKNANLQKALADGPYKRRALVPASPWLDSTAPASPAAKIERARDSLRVSLSHANEKDVFHWIVYYQYQNMPWNYILLNRKEKLAALPLSVVLGGKKQALSKIMVSAVDRTGNESVKREVALPK